MRRREDFDLLNAIRVTDFSRLPAGAKRIGEPYTSRYKSQMVLTPPMMIRSDKYPLDGLSAGVLNSEWGSVNGAPETLVEYATKPPSKEAERFLAELVEKKIDILSLFRG